MRIEIVCPSRELFGSDRSGVRLAALMQSVGAEAWLLAPSGRPERGLSKLASEARVEMRTGPVIVVSSRGAHGGSAVLRPAPASADLTIYNSAAVAARVGARGPSLLVLREWLDPASVRHRLLCALHARRARGVVAVSSPVARQWRRSTRASLPGAVIPNWLDDHWLAEGEPAEREGILFVGRLSSWKGQLVLADAFERAFGRSVARPSLTFLGAEGPESHFQRHAEALRARCTARHWRLLPQTRDPRPVFRRAALVVLPSLRPEPFGNVVLEALASGCRVIAFPGGGIDDLAPRFPGVLEVVPRGVEPLANALRRWHHAGGPAQSSVEQRQTRDKIAADFTAPAARERWRDLLGRLAL